MPYPFSLYNLLYPKDRYIWIKIRILHETNKAVLVNCGRKIWVPKSIIYGIRLKNETFEICVKEKVVL